MAVVDEIGREGDRVEGLDGLGRDRGVGLSVTLGSGSELVVGGSWAEESEVLVLVRDCERDEGREKNSYILCDRNGGTQ